MKNITKKIMALAMLVGFANISAEEIKFLSTDNAEATLNYKNEGKTSINNTQYTSYKNSDKSAVLVKTATSSDQPYYEILDIKADSKPQVAGYTVIGSYITVSSKKEKVKNEMHYLLGKRFTR